MKLRSSPINVLFLATSLLLSTHISAQEQKVISKLIEVNQQSKINITFPVGSLKLNLADTQAIKLNIVIKENDNSWFSSADLDDINLSQESTKHAIHLSIDESNLNQQWQITIPYGFDIDVALDVGDIDITGADKNIDAKISVGDIDIKLASSKQYQKIKVSAGVGDANIRGLNSVNQRRNIVSKKASWYGNGQYSITADVSVGDATVDVLD